MGSEFLTTLPPGVQRVLSEFVSAARNAFGHDLRAIVLYGSAAEGQLRASSDVNVLLVLSAFEQEKANQLREVLRQAHAAIRLNAMFLLDSEVAAAAEAFAEKFADILRRRRILHGVDPFAAVSIPREAAIVRLKQTLLNLTLRLREAYVSRSLREEQLIATIADTAGPLRSCAALLLELEGRGANSPKEALPQVAASVPEKGLEFAEAISRISEARQTGKLPHGVAEITLFRLIELAREMRARAEALS